MLLKGCNNLVMKKESTFGKKDTDIQRHAKTEN